MYETFLFLYIILFIVIAKKIYLHKHTTKWHLPCKPLQVFINLINHLASVEISLDFLKNVSDGREGPTPGVSSLRYIDKKPQYGPVTMIVPASGHQVRCIPWVQMGTFNKEIGFFVD